MSKEKGATVFGYYVDNLERFEIVEFDKQVEIINKYVEWIIAYDRE